MVCTASSIAARPRATIATSAPDAANWVAIARPSPLEPPVMMAARPAREICMGASPSEDNGRPASAGARSLYQGSSALPLVGALDSVFFGRALSGLGKRGSAMPVRIVGMIGVTPPASDATLHVIEGG